MTFGPSRESFVVQSGRFRLAAVMDRPDGAANGPLPAVFFCHGFTGSRVEARRNFVRLSNQLASRGIASVRFDHRGCGESDGDFLDFNVDGLLEDLEAVHAHFRSAPSIDQSRTAILGYSLGGVSASYLLSQDQTFRTAVFWAPVARPEIVHARLARTVPDYDGYPERGFVDDRGFRVSAEYLDQCAARLLPLKWAREFHGPALFIHGTEDTVVSPDHSDEYIAMRAVPSDRLLRIEGADHALGNADQIEHAVSETAKWLAEKLET